MNKLKIWLQSIDRDHALETVSADASFRQYYRFKDASNEGVIMDSSLQKESLVPFIAMNKRLSEAGVRVPLIYHYNVEEGFMLLEDIGSMHLSDKLSAENVNEYYKKAIHTLVQIQEANSEGLAPYDANFLLDEMNLMPQWYIKEHLGQSLECVDGRMLLGAFMFISKEVLAQPQGLFVHRDYHSRNLMIDQKDDIVVIDFQDAKAGALTYDLVSLLRDVYVELDVKEVQKLMGVFKTLKGIDVDDATFQRWFDFTGLQRHIKILGIFARLSIRDGKDNYLNDIPLTLKYILDTASKYPELKGLIHLLKREV